MDGSPSVAAWAEPEDCRGSPGETGIWRSALRSGIGIHPARRRGVGKGSLTRPEAARGRTSPAPTGSRPPCARSRSGRSTRPRPAGPWQLVWDSSRRPNTQLIRCVRRSWGQCSPRNLRGLGKPRNVTEGEGERESCGPCTSQRSRRRSRGRACRSPAGTSASCGSGSRRARRHPGAAAPRRKQDDT